MAEKIVLGTRGSQLARAQARLVGEAIQAARPELKIDTKIVVTKGDQPGRLHIGDSPRGRKGLFTADIERALLAEDVDVAVHSAKDLPSETSPGVEIAAVLQRAPIDDVLVSNSSGQDCRSSGQRTDAVAQTRGERLGRNHPCTCGAGAARAFASM
ncbi:MAG: hypothetical protein DMF37_10605 [Verrucomicrobia bacterium]|nr:MAG: hypothetical protein DMF37_10605 [Verrucomicrobiota bacterium]